MGENVSLIDGHIDTYIENQSICHSCFHSYVCEQYNENRECDNKKCHFANDHFVPDDLIDRLQAQNKDLAETIHNLIIEKDALFDKAEELKAEVERLKKEKDEYAYLYDKHINTAFSHIKAEAYKECIEKVKAFYREQKFAYEAENICEELDDILKEMVGEEK